jgi:hypothetical protein
MSGQQQLDFSCRGGIGDTGKACLRDMTTEETAFLEYSAAQYARVAKTYREAR